MLTPFKKTLLSLKIIFWAFFGVRKQSDREFDFKNFKFFPILIAALIGISMLIAILLIIIKIVTISNS